MKILQLCAVDFTAYHLLRPLGGGLRGAGYDVTFCCSPGEGLDLLRDEGFGVKAIRISRNYNVAHHGRSMAALIRFMRKERFDIVHAHTPVAGLVGRGAARIAGVRGIVYTAHGFYFHDGMSPAMHSFFAGLERSAAKFTDVIFVQSEEDREEAIRLGIASAEKLVHIGNGVDPTRFGREIHGREAARFKEEHGLGGGPVVGFVGRTVHEKGAIEFVRAAAIVRDAVPGAKFVMVGEPLRSDRDRCWDEIMRLRDELGLVRGSRAHGLSKRRSRDSCVIRPVRAAELPRRDAAGPSRGDGDGAPRRRNGDTRVPGGGRERRDGGSRSAAESRALAAATREILSSKDLMARMGAEGRARVLARFDERKIVALQIEHIGRLARKKLVK